MRIHADLDPKHLFKLYYVQAAQAAASPADQFLLFFSEEIIGKLVDYTNDKIAENHQVNLCVAVSFADSDP